jgi:hypothetical protein
VRGASGLEHARDLRDDPLAIGNLPQDADLHVVDDERQQPRVASLFERAGDRDAVQLLDASGRYRVPRVRHPLKHSGGSPDWV